MAEITRVPLQPVAKGSLTKIWLGVLVAIALGAVLAWASMPKGFSIETIVAGEGPVAEEGNAVFGRYVGKVASTGVEFDRSEDIPLPAPGIFPEGTLLPVEEGAFIDGFYQALKQAQAGATYEVYIPAEMAYGDSPPPGSDIPANAALIFELEVTGVMTREEFEVNLARMQEAMQSGIGAPAGAPAGAPGGVPGGVPGGAPVGVIPGE